MPFTMSDTRSNVGSFAVLPTHTAANPRSMIKASLYEMRLILDVRCCHKFRDFRSDLRAPNVGKHVAVILI